ncbi:uncharacterized protein LOC135106428 isoform X2 [Scylla paramamosain]|uniref:uncharacterized protein LOC135106428 isoform X2 n=1 Tax=Scylla paramamosain TaxID=85552 RepID=UPI0030831C2B
MLEGDEDKSKSDSGSVDSVSDQQSSDVVTTIGKAIASKNDRGKIRYINKNKRQGRDRTQTGIEMRSSDSGLGRASTIEGDSSTERGSESSQEGLGRAAVAAKREEMARLEKELEQEMRYRDTIQWSVDVLQQSVDELQQQLARQDQGHEEESEFKLRCEAQMALNKKLEEQTEWYQDEVDKTKEKVSQGQEYTYDQDLDQYNEFELLRLMKRLERERNNLYSDLRNSSWLLDNHSKEYHHLKELIRAYTGDLTVVNRSLEHLWRQRNFGHDSGLAGGSTPVTSPGGVKWSGQAGIRPTQRILDPRKGPIRKTAGVRSLPRLDQEELEQSNNTVFFRKARSRSRGRSKMRAKSLDTKQKKEATDSPATDLSPVLRTKSEEAQSAKSSFGVFDESYEASNEASTTASVELGSDKM